MYSLAYTSERGILRYGEGSMINTEMRIGIDLGGTKIEALAIDKQGGFPGGCRKEALARFLRLVSSPASDQDAWDSLGRPTARLPSSPLWKRWRINYDARLDEFKERAKHLAELRKQPSPARALTTTTRRPLRGGRRP